MRKRAYISSVNGLRAGEPTISQPWVAEARAILAKSNLLNIYGPRRHGKTSLSHLLLRGYEEKIGEYPAPDSYIDKVRLKPGLYNDMSMAGRDKELAHAVGRMFFDIGLTPHMLNNKSPEGMAAPMLDLVDQYHQKLRQAGRKKLRLVFDEFNSVMKDPEFRSFFSAFARGIEQRKDIKLIIVSAWPLAVYNYGTDNTVFPEVRIKKWDRETSRRYYNYVYIDDPALKDASFDQMFSAFGGCPFLFNRNASGWNMSNSADEYHSIAHGMLAGADQAELLHALEMLSKLGQGQTIIPDDAFSRAAAMHLLIAGIAAENAEGHLVNAGTAYSTWNFDRLRLRGEEAFAKDPRYPRAETTGIRFEPLMAERGGLNQRPVQQRAVGARQAARAEAI